MPFAPAPEQKWPAKETLNQWPEYLDTVQNLVHFLMNQTARFTVKMLLDFGAR